MHPLPDLPHDPRFESSSPAAAGRLAPIPLSPLPERPLVSILVGTFNYEKYLPLAIDSVLKQSYEYWELLIVDDGSTDQSWPLLEQYAQKNRRISIAKQQNGGHGAALNTAFGMAQGQIIALLDADDAFHPDKLRRIVEQFHAHPDAGIVIHKLQRITAEGRAYGDATPDTLVSGYLGPQALRQGGNVSGVPPTSGLAFRTDAAQEVFPIPSIFRRAADAYLFRLAQFITPVASVHDALSLYRIHGANVTASGINAATMQKLVEDYHRVFAAQQRFLEAGFGTKVSSQLDIRSAPGYCEFVLSAALLSGTFPEGTPFAGISAVLASMHRAGRRTLWRWLCRLPRAVAVPTLSGLLKLWWGESWLATAFRIRIRQLGF